MFYLCLGPAGASFSIDSVIRKSRKTESSGAATPGAPLIEWSSAATVAIRLMQIHLALIYGAMLIAQLQGAAWWQGTAVWWLMARPESRLVNLTFLAGMGERPLTYLMNIFTYAVLLYEFCFAVLIWNPLARPILLVGGNFRLGRVGAGWRGGQLLRADVYRQSGILASRDAAAMERKLPGGMKDFARGAG